MSAAFAFGKEGADSYYWISEHCVLSPSNSCPYHALGYKYEPSQILRLENIQCKRIWSWIRMRQIAFESRHDAFLQFCNLVQETWLPKVLKVSAPSFPKAKATDTWTNKSKKAENKTLQFESFVWLDYSWYWRCEILNFTHKTLLNCLQKVVYKWSF